MWKTIILAMVAGLAINGAAWAQDATFTGFTTAVTEGHTGTGTRAAMCEAEFPGSRMCNSADVMHLDPPIGEGWVQPVIITSVTTNVMDISGLRDGSLSCSGWTGFSVIGLILQNDGAGFSGLRTIHCHPSVSGSLPVACCTPQAAEQTQTEVIWSRPGESGQSGQ